MFKKQKTENNFDFKYYVKQKMLVILIIYVKLFTYFFDIYKIYY